MFERHHQSRAGWTRTAALIAVFVIVSLAAVWVWRRPTAQPTVDAGRTVVETFLTQIREGHPDQAWDATTAEFKSAQGKESFVRKVRPLKFLKEPLSFVSVQTVNIGDQPRTEYLYQAPKGESLRIVLGRENGDWRVDRWMVTSGS